MCDCCDCDAGGGGESARQAAAWRESGHHLVWLFWDKRRWDLNDELYEISEALQNDDPIDADTVRAAREELDQVRWVLEDHIAAMADGVEEWGAGAGKKTPYRVMIEQLEDRGYDVARPGERREETEIEVSPSGP